MDTANEVVSRLQGQIANAIIGQFPGVGAALQDDLRQEAYLGLLEGFKPGNTDSYYIQLAVNRARDYMREKRRAVRNESLPHDIVRRTGDRAIPGAEELADIYGMDVELVHSNLNWD